MRTLSSRAATVAACTILGLLAACSADGPTDPADEPAVESATGSAPESATGSATGPVTEGESADPASPGPSASEQPDESAGDRPDGAGGNRPDDSGGNQPDGSSGDQPDDPAVELVGPDCAEYAEQFPGGPAGIDRMAQRPASAAISRHPSLSRFSAAVSGELNPQVDLVQRMNRPGITVFAPVDDAFADLPRGTMEFLRSNTDLLTSILTYHLLPRRMAPAELVGERVTVEGGTVRVTRTGDRLQVNRATVVCGGIRTANATVYLLDSVLLPQ